VDVRVDRGRIVGPVKEPLAPSPAEKPNAAILVDLDIDQSALPVRLLWRYTTHVEDRQRPALRPPLDLAQLGNVWSEPSLQWPDTADLEHPPHVLDGGLEQLGWAEGRLRYNKDVAVESRLGRHRVTEDLGIEQVADPL
jgi:hypothetical protein